MTVGRVDHGNERRVALATGAFDPLNAELAGAVAAGLESRGDLWRWLADPAAQASGETVLLVGYPRYLARFLRSPHVGARVLWTGEPLHSPRPEAATSWWARWFATLPSPVSRALRPLRAVPLPAQLADRRATALVAREWRRNLADLLAAAERVDRVVATSRDRAALLATYGVQAATVPFGYAPAVAGTLADPASKRDVPVALLGRLAGPGRRSRAMRRLDLGALSVVAVDGQWGPDRNAALRRSRVVLDVHRVPGSFVGYRLLLGLAAGAAVVTEPMADPHPFVPGVHFVSAPLEALADEAAALIADEPRRRRIVEAGQELLRGELAMERCLERVLG